MEALPVKTPGSAPGPLPAEHCRGKEEGRTELGSGHYKRCTGGGGRETEDRSWKYNSSLGGGATGDLKRQESGKALRAEEVKGDQPEPFQGVVLCSERRSLDQEPV